ncbi:DNA repair endonuclease XPF [Babesia gibsoni]|uniref:DNA repair endonuclease XPF n=1 Tax=Babesia gibsoni TaxID=33632 RepID=A0AAD8LK45_BABGI|nr:DNA repair endonuclease XPF [Babesia gibsoni]
MLPLPYEKAILRRVIPTWEELICRYVANGSFTKAELSLSKCIRRVPESALCRIGVQDALLILSPGCDNYRLLFYLLVYVLNPLHVYDSESSEYRVVFREDCPRKVPMLGLQNVEMALKSERTYHRLFDLSSNEYASDNQSDRLLFPHIFHDIKLRGALEMRSRLILVLGIGLDESAVVASQFARFIKKLCHMHPSNGNSMCARIPLPKFLDGTVLANEREKMYIEGGIYFVPSRILLVDLLTYKIVPELISGVIIVNAHRMTKDYNIPFAIKLIRSRNNLAFVKAITDNVASMRNRDNLTFLLKSLFTKECFIFPRCSSIFDNVLSNEHVQPVTFEVGFQLSEKAKQIHSTIVQVLHRLVMELQRSSNKELQQIDMNSVMYNNNVKKMLENILQKVHASTSEYHIRRLMRSITNLHMLLNQLLGMNALNFLAFAEKLKSAEMDSDWLWTPYGTTIYKQAVSRVYEPKAEEAAGLVMNIDTDKKKEYIRSILCDENVGCEELGNMVKAAMRWHSCKKPWKVPWRYKTTPKRSNLSYYVTRRELCRREARHLRRICRFFECGGMFFRRAMIVVDSNFLQEHLSSCLSIPSEKYNELAFLAYATRRADRYEFAPQEDVKYSGYSQAHFYRSYIKSQEEVDKMLHRFVVWTKYNEIYRKTNQKERESEAHTNGECIPVDITNKVSDEIRNNIHEVDDDNIFIDDNRRRRLDDDPISSGDDELEIDTSVKRRTPPTPVKAKRQDSHYTLSININSMMRCNVKIINVSFTQPRNEVLKGIMARKLNADDSKEHLPVTCSPDEFGYALHLVKPSVIIVYRPNIKVFRIIEQYCAQRFIYGQRNYIRVYVLSYRDCLESHRFAREIKNELECWQQLQQSIKTLPITFDETVLISSATNDSHQKALQERSTQSPSAANNTTAALSDKTQTGNSTGNSEISPFSPPVTSSLTPSDPSQNLAVAEASVNGLKPSSQVFVDTREFRCRLPYHLYSRSIQLVPLVLEMGDYLISRDICIERKSIHDLVSSLSSGRLAQQAEELCSVYEFPFLLLEFEDSETFHLSPCSDDNSLGFNYIYSKLCILCCNYPKLRIIWSQSPKSSATVLAMLKLGRSEPDIMSNNMIISQARGSLKVNDENKEAIVSARRRPEDVSNRDALRILRKIPGITSYNIGEILSRVNSLRELSEMEEKDLVSFLPEANAHAIYTFFNQRIAPSMFETIVT